MAESADRLKALLFAGRFSVRGQCAYTLRLAEYLPKHGFDVQVVCPDASMVSPEQRRELGIRQFPHLMQPVWGRVVLELLARQLAYDPVDILHCQSSTALSSALWLARELERPLILTVHDFLPQRRSLRIDRQVCVRVIAVSDAVRNHLVERYHVPRDLITVVSSGVVCKRDEPIPPILNAGKVPVIGTAGPLEAVKGFPYFLGAAAHVLATGRDVEFLIAGAGPEEKNLRRLARELGVTNHVTFVPNLMDFDEALEAMDIFCLPSLQQGLGTIMLEAMALGRPVIATRVGGVFQVIQDGKTGLLVPPTDSRQLADRMLQLLDRPDDARQLGQAASAEVSCQFNVERMIDQTVKIYREVLDASAVAATSS